MSEISVPQSMLEENAQILSKFESMGVTLSEPVDMEYVVTVPNRQYGEALQAKLGEFIPQADYKLEDVDDGVDVYMLVGILPEVELVSQIEVLMQSAANQHKGGQVAWGFHAES